ncbi:Lipopolysaccharide kinase [Orpheovirus IHUMI-LCC2]|uniref:Lipopolysaccharide kinase n=1 Tax=Orpheovirus IHUMI-LCC2 TaxID=2023057 RepID=A0A2I2L3Q4_9VIRU|nr:Lipopolysaccharide kinase [Orpheovirus IHUMI-LCC2]SNW62166.1 Lipopolysaccharide kinase [Orpheovirus IHUMI-LCC2]
MEKYYIKYVRPGLVDKGYKYGSYIDYAVNEAKLCMEAGKYVNAPKIYKYYGYIDEEPNNVKMSSLYRRHDDDDYNDAIKESIMYYGVDFRDECIIMENLHDCVKLDVYIKELSNKSIDDYKLLKEVYELQNKVKNEFRKLHNVNIIHGDVNLGNILYNKITDKIYIIDYESSKLNIDDNDRKEAELLHIEYYVLQCIVKLLSSDNIIKDIKERVKYLNDIVWY